LASAIAALLIDDRRYESIDAAASRFLIPSGYFSEIFFSDQPVLPIRVSTLSVSPQIRFRLEETLHHVKAKCSAIASTSSCPFG
jgi:hypothetical protein